MEEDLDLPLDKVAISGPTLASIIQRFSSSSQGDVDGLLFGHVTQPTPSNLLDDDDDGSTTHNHGSPTLVANITGYMCSGTLPSFYDPLGRLDFSALGRSFVDGGDQRRLIGWFVGRRRTPLRPSMREFSVSASLSSSKNPNPPLLVASSSSSSSSSSCLNFSFPPCVFLLLSTPLSEQLIHTHEYRAFQFRRSTCLFEPKTLDVINIGPAFRGHYGSFSPNSPFPWLSFSSSSAAAAAITPNSPPPPSSYSSTGEGEGHKDKKEESLISLRRLTKEQRGLEDLCAQGFDVGRLSKLMGEQAANYTLELEDLYGKMLAKLDGLARLVEKTSSMVLDQEHRNLKLRNKFSGLE